MKQLFLITTLIFTLVFTTNINSQNSDLEDISKLEQAVVSHAENTLALLYNKVENFNTDPLLSSLENKSTVISNTVDSTFKQGGDLLKTTIINTEETLKEGYNTVAPVIMQVVEFIIEEGSILIKQFLAFKAIEALLPIIIGFILLFYVSKRIKSLFTITKEEYTSLLLEEKDSKEKTKDETTFDYDITDDVDAPCAVLKFYFSHPLYALFFFTVYLLNLGGALFLIMNTGILFIKITLFPKLYLFEFLTQYL